MSTPLARRKGNTKKLLWMHGIGNILENMSFGVMEMPVQGSNPGASRGIFSGATTTGYPTRRALKPSREGYCLWIGQDYQASPTWILVLTQEFTGSQDFCQSLCEKISVKKQVVFQDFPRFFRGLCPLALPRSVQVFPSCQVG